MDCSPGILQNHGISVISTTNPSISTTRVSVITTLSLHHRALQSVTQTNLETSILTAILETVTSRDSFSHFDFFEVNSGNRFRSTMIHGQFSTEMLIEINRHLQEKHMMEKQSPEIMQNVLEKYKLPNSTIAFYFGSKTQSKNIGIASSSDILFMKKNIKTTKFADKTTFLQKSNSKCSK